MSSVPVDRDVQAAEQAGRLREVVGTLLTGSQLDRLLSMWRECQASQAHCSVPGFVDRVASELQLGAELAGKLRMKLFAEVLARRSAVQRARVGAPVKVADAAPVPRADAASQVFAALIAQLDALLRNRYDARWSILCAALAGQLRAMPVAGFQIGPLLRGERGPAELALTVTAEPGRQALVHAYYLGLCEVLGPMPADRLLSDAVKQVEQLPAAASYSPRRLL
jgi:hypothetical protein